MIIVSMTKNVSVAASQSLMPNTIFACFSVSPTSETEFAAGFVDLEISSSP